MNYLAAEVDDFNGPVSMEVGAMKGSDRKGDKGKKGYDKGKCGKSFGVRQRLRERLRERQGQGKERQRQGTRKRGKTGTQFELRRSLQVMWQVGP